MSHECPEHAGEQDGVAASEGENEDAEGEGEEEDDEHPEGDEDGSEDDYEEEEDDEEPQGGPREDGTDSDHEEHDGNTKTIEEEAEEIGDDLDDLSDPGRAGSPSSYQTANQDNVASDAEFSEDDNMVSRPATGAGEDECSGEDGLELPEDKFEESPFPDQSASQNNGIPDSDRNRLAVFQVASFGATSIDRPWPLRQQATSWDKQQTQKKGGMKQTEEVSPNLNRRKGKHDRWQWQLPKTLIDAS